MATRAYILIECTAGKVKDVIEVLKSLQEFNAVDEVTGPYDVIATVATKDINAIGELVTTKVHPILGVNRTVSCLAI
jgi:DNA-binding Lrp family transcriptional regulator